MKKTITPEQLIAEFSGYCVDKMNENMHKSNPFDEDIFSLMSAEAGEGVEFVQALTEYFKAPTAENRLACFREGADKINYILFQLGIISGEKLVLTRG